MLVRPAAAQDLPAIQSIYAHHVLNGLASFEEEAPPLEEMRRRYEEITGRGLPYLVAEEKGEILGYGYCSLYRARSAYRFTLEDSIYVKNGRQGKGIGNMLMDYCIDIARKVELKSVWMEILKENRRMIKFGFKYGFRQAYDDGDMVKVVLGLEQPVK